MHTSFGASYGRAVEKKQGYDTLAIRTIAGSHMYVHSCSAWRL